MCGAECPAGYPSLLLLACTMFELLQPVFQNRVTRAVNRVAGNMLQDSCC